MAAIESTSSSGVGIGVTSQTWSHTVTSANKLVITIGIGDSGATNVVSSVTYAGASCTLVGQATDSTFERAVIYEKHDPAAGANNVVVTYDGQVNHAACGATGFTNAATSLGTPTGTSGNSTNPSVTVADSASGDIVVSVVASDVGPNATMTPGGTQLWEVEDAESDSDFNAQHQTASGANTVCSWTCSSADSYAAIGVAVKDAGGGGGGSSTTWVGYIG